MKKFQRWPGYSVAAGAVILFLCGSGLAVSGFVSYIYRPRISCENPVFDFGRRGGSEVEHEFVIKNRGRQTLTIHDVRRSCSCTTVDIPTTVVEPGDAVGVGVCLSLWGRKGKLEQQIVIASNDPAMPDYILSVKGEVK